MRRMTTTTLRCAGIAVAAWLGITAEQVQAAIILGSVAMGASLVQLAHEKTHNADAR